MEQINIEQYRIQLLEQRNMLDDAIQQLKKEFIGIDTVIDQISTSITSWLFFPEMQDRPLIINLWGLTGTGKTSLIKRLAELIGFSDYYFRFDLGENTSRYFDIQDSFKDIYENCDGKPFIIGLDEFQLARTINEEQEEIDRSSIRAVWDLLDCGKFEIVNFEYNLTWFGKMIKKLDISLDKGVEVKDGVVTKQLDIFKETVCAKEEDQDDEIKNTYFVGDNNLGIIFDLVDHLFLSKENLRSELNKLNGDQTIDYLITLYKASLKPQTVDCTKALIFVMGNLDEVYSMSRNFNPDMSANAFHRQSCEITVTEVKAALLNRFRSEQIARLGNNHIIYPAFNEKAFQDIIRLELEKVSKKMFDAYHINIEFDDKLEQLIYEEGVYPTQGTRPLFTTIHQIVNTRLGKVLNEIYLNGFLADTILFSINPSETKEDHVAIQISFLQENQVIHQLIDHQLLVLGKLRKEKKNDQQAIVAVHESGHAILSSILMKTVPDVVFSVTADSESNGFVLSHPEWNYVSKKEVINRLAVLLGGWVAESVVFGEENVTIGSSSDLNKATQLATYVIYSCGMGSIRATFSNENMASSPSIIFDHNETVNKDAKELLIQTEILAKETLMKQRILLLRMADYLSDKRTINKKDIREFLEKYAVDFHLEEIIENADHLFYRNQLKKLVEQI